MSQLLYELPTHWISQKFFKPNNVGDFIIYKDYGVYCPDKGNPYQTNTGKISISAVCFDCIGFIDFDQKSSKLTCIGKAKIKITKNDLKNFLDSEEYYSN